MNMRHLVLLTLLAALILVLAGLYLFERQRAVAPIDSASGASWDTVAGYVETPTETVVQPQQESLPDTIAPSNNPQTLTIPKKVSTSTATIIQKPGDDSFDYNALLGRLAHDETPASGQKGQTYTDLMGAFTFTPAKQYTEQKLRTPVQEALFAYGNEIGRRVQGFAMVNPNIAQTVVNQATHRDNQGYGDAVVELGRRYKALGEGILSFHDVPTVAESAHKALGESYVNLGEALSAVPAAADDQAFLSSITDYNHKADAFTLAFVGMVQLFSSNDVTFEQSDSGSAFSFRH